MSDRLLLADYFRYHMAACKARMKAARQQNEHLFPHPDIPAEHKRFYYKLRKLYGRVDAQRMIKEMETNK